jgi:enoyl-CoA hydratase/carnithine racemase
VIEAALFPLLTGWGRAREILLLGETFSAREALAWGLVEHVVPTADLDQAIEAWIGKLLTSAPRAVRLQKRVMSSAVMDALAEAAAFRRHHGRH